MCPRLKQREKSRATAHRHPWLIPRTFCSNFRHSAVSARATAVLLLSLSHQFSPLLSPLSSPLSSHFKCHYILSRHSTVKDTEVPHLPQATQVAHRDAPYSVGGISRGGKYDAPSSRARSMYSVRARLSDLRFRRNTATADGRHSDQEPNRCAENTWRTGRSVYMRARMAAMDGELLEQYSRAGAPSSTANRQHTYTHGHHAVIHAARKHKTKKRSHQRRQDLRKLRHALLPRAGRGWQGRRPPARPQVPRAVRVP